MLSAETGWPDRWGIRGLLQRSLDTKRSERERLVRVKEGLAKLPPRTREIFLMHRLAGFKYREIAAQYGISQSAVEKHIAEAVLFLTEWTQDW